MSHTATVTMIFTLVSSKTSPVLLVINVIVNKISACGLYLELLHHLEKLMYPDDKLHENENIAELLEKISSDWTGAPLNTI